MKKANPLHEPKRIIRRIIRLPRRIRCDIRLKYASAMAEHEHSLTGDRIFVTLGDEKKKSLVVIDRKGFRCYKKRGAIVQKARMADLMTESFYFTADKSGHGGITKEEARIRRYRYLLICKAL